MSRQTGVLPMRVATLFAFLPGWLSARTMFPTILARFSTPPERGGSGIKAGVCTLAQIRESEYTARRHQDYNLWLDFGKPPQALRHVKGFTQQWRVTPHLLDCLVGLKEQAAHCKEQ